MRRCGSDAQAFPAAQRLPSSANESADEMRRKANLSSLFTLLARVNETEQEETAKSLDPGKPPISLIA